MGLTSGPFWIARAVREGVMVDNLGLRQPGLVMANALLPGITNTTSRARQYSLIAWLRAYGTSEGHMRRMESAYVHAVRNHEHSGPNPATGAVGSNAVPEAADGVYRIAHDRDLPSVQQPAYYGPSARYLGIEWKTRRPSPTEETVALAKSLGIPRSAVPSAEDSMVSAAALSEIARLCPCQSPNPEERQILERLLFRIGENRSGGNGQWDARRRRGMAYLLHAVQEGESSSDGILQLALDRVFGRIESQAPAALVDEEWGFAVMGLRWHFRHALESMWTAFGRILADDTTRHDSIDSICAAALVDGDNSHWQPGRATPLSDVVAAIETEREPDCLKAIKTPAQVDPPRSMRASAVVLALIARRIRTLDTAGRFYSPLLASGDAERVSLKFFAEQFTPETRFADWLDHLVRRFVVEQHYRVAQRKWLDGLDGYFFCESDGGLALMKAVDLWYPDGGRTKIDAALQLMCDIGLIEKTSPRWTLTNLGLDVFQRVLADPGERIHM